MPANLPPMYFEAEKRFRAAKTAPDKIVALEEMLSIMPKHKGTDHLRAELRRRIAKLTQTIDKKSATQRASMVIPKEGAAQVAVVGLPNSGKSQIVARITNASPSVADYPYTTQTATPGMMPFENIQIQLIDTPPLGPHTVEYWIPHTLRRADALLIVTDLSDYPVEQMEAITTHLEEMRIGIGGEKVEEEEAVRLAPMKALIIGNKIDLQGADENYKVLQEKYEGRLPVIGVSAREGRGLEELKTRIFDVLDIIRVYTKTPGQKPDMNDPIIIARGSTLEDAAEEIHKDFRARMKYARLWGSGKHDGIMVKKDHVLEDGDIIELHI
jgi:small GTP-binding protein